MNHDLLKEDLDVTLKFCTDNHIFPFYGEILNVKEGMKPDFTIASDNLDNFLESIKFLGKRVVFLKIERNDKIPSDKEINKYMEYCKENKLQDEIEKYKKNVDKAKKYSGLIWHLEVSFIYDKVSYLYFKFSDWSYCVEVIDEARDLMGYMGDDWED